MLYRVKKPLTPNMILFYCCGEKRGGEETEEGKGLRVGR